jgi:Fe-S cluster assembly iron-binding protein IscA
MLVLTDEATQAIEQILSEPSLPESAGVRIGLATSPDGRGPAPAALEVSIVETPVPTDSVIAEHGARVFLDEAIADQLDDKLLDARVSDDGVRFALSDQAG